MAATEWIALGTGIVGCVTGVVSLGWNIRSSRREDPDLHVRIRLLGPDAGDLLVGVIENKGRFEATITFAFLTWFPDTLRGIAKVTWEKGRKYAYHASLQLSDEDLTGITLPLVVKGKSGASFRIMDFSALEP
jgi:hypothetical protein